MPSDNTTADLIANLKGKRLRKHLFIREHRIMIFRREATKSCEKAKAENNLQNDYRTPKKATVLPTKVLLHRFSIIRYKNFKCLGKTLLARIFVRRHQITVYGVFNEYWPL